MSRTITVNANTTIGYSFVNTYFYIIHRDTVTTRLTATEIKTILDIVVPSNTITTDEIQDLKDIVEDLSAIHYTMSDDSLGAKSLWFNDYKSYALILSSNTISINGTNLVYPITSYSIPSKIINSIRNFFLTNIGLNITYEDLSILYNFLVTSRYNKPIYNIINAKEDEVDYYTYSNTLSTLEDASVVYTATYNPSDDYGYDISLGNIKYIDASSKTICFEDIPVGITIKAGDKIKVTGSTIYMSGANYNSDGIYTIASITPVGSVTNIVTEESIPYSYDPFASIVSMNKETNTITLNSLYEINQLAADTKVVVDNATGTKYSSSNITKVGSLADVQGVLSNFTTANYAKTDALDFNSASTWTITMKCIFYSNTTTNQTIFSHTSDYRAILRSSTNGKFQLYLSSNGSSWNIASAVESIQTIQANVNYILRLKFTGTQYILEYSTDNGDSYLVAISINSTTKVTSNFNMLSIGAYKATQPMTYGSIDLNGCSVILDDVVAWKGTTMAPFDNSGTYTVSKSYTTSSLTTALVVEEAFNGNFTAPTGGPYGLFSLYTKPTANLGASSTSVLLDVTKSINTDKLPETEFLLDSTDQLTSYLKTANSALGSIMAIPTSTNYSNFNSTVPTSLTLTGLSIDLTFEGLYSDVHSS